MATAVEVLPERPLPSLPVLHEGTTHPVFDEMPLWTDMVAKSEQIDFEASVIWDDELQHDDDSHDGLLKQLAGCVYFLVDEEPEPVVQKDIHDELHLDAACDVFAEMSIDNAVAEPSEQILLTQVMGSHTQAGEMTEIPCEIQWDEEIAHELYTFDQDVFAEGVVKHSEVGSMTSQYVLRLAKIHMPRSLGGLEVAAPELNSKGSTFGTYVPWRLRVVEPDVLFPLVGDSMPISTSLAVLNQNHQEIKVNIDCLVNKIHQVNERSYGSYGERGEPFLSLQESSVSCAASDPLCDEDIQCCLDAHYGLLGQLAMGSEYVYGERINQIAKLGVSDVHIRTDGLLISPESDLFTAKKVLEGILNENLNKDILVGLEQLYESSEKGAQQKSRNISLLPIWSDAFGDLESPEMDMLRAQTGQEEANLGAPDYQLCKVALGVSGFVSYLSWVLQLDMATTQDFAEMSAVQEMNHSRETFAISGEKQEARDLQIVFAESQQWMKLHTCKIQEAHVIPNINKYNLYKVAASSRRQWDPGIMELHVIQLGCECQCCHESYLWTICSNAVCKHLLNTTAWGQAVFRGSGNVMTHMWPRRSPSDVRPIDPSFSPSAAQVLTYTGRSAARRRASNRIEKQPKRGNGRASSSSGMMSKKTSRCQLLSLTKLTLEGFPNSKYVRGLLEFPSLKSLYLLKMTNLEELWTTTNGIETHGGQFGAKYCFPVLSELFIKSCPKLNVKPYFPPSLVTLSFQESNEQLLCPGSSSDLYLPLVEESSSSSSMHSAVSHLRVLNLTEMTTSSSSWEFLQFHTELVTLSIDSCGDLTQLPETIRSLTSLENLCINRCSNLAMMPEWLGELRLLRSLSVYTTPMIDSLPQSTEHLKSITMLQISGWRNMKQLPDVIQHLFSLELLNLANCSALTVLPEWIGQLSALRRIWIQHCSALECLPQSIQRLTALRELKISWCRGLYRRYKRGLGPDWHLISHIPDVRIDGRLE